MMGKIIQKRNTLRKKGFSIVEALIAIVILTLGFTAGMGLLSNSTQIVGATNDLTIATYLAEEGIEIARLKRDNNILEYYNVGPGTPWDSIGSGSTFADCVTGCRVDASTIVSGVPTMATCSGCATGEILYKKAGTYIGVYTPDSSGGATPTNLRRVVTATPIGTEAYEISSTVWYTSRAAERSITLTDVLYNVGAF